MPVIVPSRAELADRMISATDEFGRMQSCSPTVTAGVAMQDEYQAHEGFLLLADISGYTAFLVGTELTHAQAIIHELTTLLRTRLAPPMRFVKVEGDAVFCFADSDVFGDSERFVELIEVCYFEFSNQLMNMALSTTCTCAACSAISSLDLKFVAHFGTFVIDVESNGEDLAGSDVILVHRLLKNTVSDGDGPSAYALFTDACLRRLECLNDVAVHNESDEVLGDMTGGVYDLEPVLATMRETRREYISSEEADLESVVDVPVPPTVAWKYFVEPLERQRWACRQFSKDPDRVTRNETGRVGQGAAMHCNHGPGTWTWEFVDWRPYQYFTSRTATAPVVGRFIGPRPQMDTVEFVPIEAGGTRIIHRIRLSNRGRMSLFTYRGQRRLVAAFWRHANALLANVIREDADGRLDATVRPNSSP